MPITMRGNYIFASPNEKHYLIASNYTNYLLLGDPSGSDYFLEAMVVEDEFVINARLYIPRSGSWCTLKNNVPSGSGCTRQILSNGYRVQQDDGSSIIGLEVERNCCHLTANIFDSTGSMVAKDENRDFLILKGPAIIGKSGEAIGISIG